MQQLLLAAFYCATHCTSTIHNPHPLSDDFLQQFKSDLPFSAYRIPSDPPHKNRIAKQFKSTMKYEEARSEPSSMTEPRSDICLVLTCNQRCSTIVKNSKRETTSPPGREWLAWHRDGVQPKQRGRYSWRIKAPLQDITNVLMSPL